MDFVIKSIQKSEVDDFAKEQWLINDKKFNFLPQRETFYFAVYKDGQITGYAQTEIRGGVVETRSLLVKDNLQGNGIGTKLLTHVEKWAKTEKACNKSIIKTSAAWPKSVHFYEKLGYKKDAVLPKYYYGVDWYYMSKKL